MTHIPIPKNQWRHFRKSIGHSIKTARKAKNMSIEELCEKTGHSPQKMRGFEDRHSTIRLYDLLHIAIALDVKPETLLTILPDPPLKT